MQGEIPQHDSDEPSVTNASLDAPDVSAARPGTGAHSRARESLNTTFQTEGPASARTAARDICKVDTVDPNRRDSTRARHGSQDAFLQIPVARGAARRPAETSIWDWDIGSDNAAEPISPYYYELQGELLQDQRNQRRMQAEVTFPESLPRAGSQWQLTDTTISDTARVTGSGSTARNKRKSTSEAIGASTSQASKRSSRMGPPPPAGEESTATGSSRTARSRQPSAMDPSELLHPRTGLDTDPATPATGAEGVSGRRASVAEGLVSLMLPPRKVFPIQIGDKLFRLSGASISSDSPSFFSQFFEEQLRNNTGADSVRTLYIDRDPATFEDISLHLQGYHIEPRDGPHFVRLFADAQFFSLPRLTARLFSSTIYIRIGDEEFQIPRDLFSSPGDSPNYFSLGFSAFFATPSINFTGLSHRASPRPPPILPPSVPNRSAKTFADLLHMLKGYPVEVRSAEHRAELLRDARYFHLKGLEQRLIPHEITYNLARKTSEIALRLEDIRPSGISIIPDSAGLSSEATSPDSASDIPTLNEPGWVAYQRPYVDSEVYSLVLEINGGEKALLSLAPRSSPAGGEPARIGRATFFGPTLSRIANLFSVVANKRTSNPAAAAATGSAVSEHRASGAASVPASPVAASSTTPNLERVKVRIGPDADVTLDGRKWTVGDEDATGEMDVDEPESSSSSPATVRRANKARTRPPSSADEAEEWVLKKAQWRLRVQPVSGGAASQQAGRRGVEVILGAVKLEAYSTERSRNVARAFLA